MKNFFTLVFTVSSLFFLSSCAIDEEIADELIDYYNNEWIPIHETKEQEMDTAKKAVLNITTELEDDHAKEIIAIHETDIIPAADKALNRYESLQLNHRQVKKLNKMQIKAEKYGIDLLKSIIDYNNGDISASQYRQMDNELEREFYKINDYLEEIMHEYNLEYDKENDSIEGYYELKRKED